MEEKTLHIQHASTLSDTIWCILRDENEHRLSELEIGIETISNKEYYIPEYKDKKVLYITNFRTLNKYMKKGYGTYLLKKVIEKCKEKDKYDMIHLNACPFYITQLGAIYEPPKNGLEMHELIQFYKNAGFEEYKEKQTIDYKCMIMIMNLK